MRCLASFARRSVVGLFLVVAGTARADATLTTLATFTGGNGSYAADSLAIDSAGTLYGVTSFGGDLTLNNGSGYGTVFSLNPQTKALTTLVQFNGTNGSYPTAGVIIGSDGNLYGTTSQSGPGSGEGSVGFGTIFSLNPTTHALDTLGTFNALTGPSAPDGRLVQDASGNLYGTTYSSGPLARAAPYFPTAARPRHSRPLRRSILQIPPATARR